MSELLVLGGTRPSASLVDELVGRGITPYVSVVRESARRLYPNRLSDRLQVGSLDRTKLSDFIHETTVDAILDATHPYADRISKNAISVSQSLELDYLYLNRPSNLPTEHEQLVRVSEWDDAVEVTRNYETVFLTVGIKHLDMFRNGTTCDRYLIRVLPREASMEAARDAGFTHDDCIVDWPPESVDAEREIIEEHDVNLLLTKESGPPGGVPQKWSAVRESGIEMCVVERPDVRYPGSTTDLSEAVKWCTNRAKVPQ